MSHSHYRLVDAETGRVIVPRLERADSLVAKTVGLLGRRTFEAGTALWIDECSVIHTFGMCFPIDVLFLNKEFRALKVCCNLPTWRICGPVWGAKYVVEFPAGTLNMQRIGLGNRYLCARS